MSDDYRRYNSMAYIRQIRERYPEGTRVELVMMEDPYNTKLKPGDQGTVTYVDALGTVFVDWDNGSKLGLVHGEDVFRII